MKLDFDLGDIKAVEFGVGLEGDDEQLFRILHVDNDVQDALREMAVETLRKMSELEDGPRLYEPSEKYANMEHIYLPSGSDYGAKFIELHEADSLKVDNGALKSPEKLIFYFARFTDGKNRRLTSLRRASHFKGIVKDRLLRFSTNTLKLVKGNVFRLDSDFDFLVDSKNIHILRPSSFEYSAKLQDAILSAVPQNIEAISKDLPYVDFSEIERYSAVHPRAARYIASIRVQEEVSRVDKAALKSHCKATGVQFKVEKGKIIVDSKNVLGFLEVLDRRRYNVELVPGAPEMFRAGSRSKI